MPSATEVRPLPGEPVTSAEAAAVRRRTFVFFVTALGAFMASLDLSIVNVAFPALERAFPHDSRASLAWVITGYSIVFASLLVTAGRSADRLGRRRLFFIGLGVFTFGSALCGIAPSVDLLIAGRFIQGSGAAAMLPASLGLLLGAFPSERRSQIVALWGGIGALAVATGPSLGGVLVTGAGWRWVFFVNLPIGAVGYLVGRRVLTETTTVSSGEKAGLRRRRPGQRDVGGPRAGDHRRTQLGLVERTRRRLLCRCPPRGSRLPPPVGAPPRTRPRPHPLPSPVLHRGQRGHGPVRHGLLRHAAGQHPVPHQRLALLDPEGGTRRHPRTPGGRPRLRSGGTDRPTGRFPEGPAGRIRLSSPVASAGTPPPSASTLPT